LRVPEEIAHLMEVDNDAEHVLEALH